MNLSKLSDNELLAKTRNAAADERSATTRLLHHLIEVERRRLFAKEGFNSLFEYCVQALHMSEPQAARRVNAARVMKEVPAIESKIESGTLNITNVSLAQSLFKREATAKIPVSPAKKIEILEQLENQSTRSADRILNSYASAPEVPRKEHTRAVSENLTELRMTIDQHTLADLHRLKEIWSHEFPAGNLADIIKKAAELCRAKLDPLVKASKSRVSETAPEKVEHVKESGKPATPAPELKQKLDLKRTRYIDATTRNQVWLRDGGICTYSDEVTGRICKSRHRLQLDHIRPFAKGGTNTADNLRLRCLTHNQWHAIQSYGDEVLRYMK